MFQNIDHFMRHAYEWTWHLSGIGLFIWIVYSFGSVITGAIAAYSAFYWATIEENPPFFLNPLIIIFGLVTLFLIVGLTGEFIFTFS